MAYTLQVYYDTNDDTEAGPSGAGKLDAQTFTTVDAFSISRVSLKLFRIGSPGTLTVSIRATSANLPTGGDLVSGTFNANAITATSPGEWVDINFSPALALTATTKYAIVITAGPDTSNRCFWRYDGSSATYAGGNRCSFNGSTWSSAATSDQMFRTYNTTVDYIELTGTDAITIVGTVALTYIGYAALTGTNAITIGGTASLTYTTVVHGDYTNKHETTYVIVAGSDAIWVQD